MVENKHGDLRKFMARWVLTRFGRSTARELIGRIMEMAAIIRENPRYTSRSVQFSISTLIVAEAVGGDSRATERAMLAGVVAWLDRAQLAMPIGHAMRNLRDLDPLLSMAVAEHFAAMAVESGKKGRFVTKQLAVDVGQRSARFRLVFDGLKYAKYQPRLDGAVDYIELLLNDALRIIAENGYGHEIGPLFDVRRFEAGKIRGYHEAPREFTSDVMDLFPLRPRPEWAKYTNSGKPAHDFKIFSEFVWIHTKAAVMEFQFPRYE